MAHAKDDASEGRLLISYVRVCYRTAALYAVKVVKATESAQSGFIRLGMFFS